jgi:hypothetical protein
MRRHFSAEDKIRIYWKGFAARQALAQQQNDRFGSGRWIEVQ